MKNYILSSIVGGIVLFVWGFVSHAILPWYDGVWNQFTDEQAVSRVLQGNAPEKGLYYLPYSEEPSESYQTEAFINILPPDSLLNPSYQMAMGMVINILSVFLVVLLLSKTKEMSYREMVGFFALAGLVIGFVSHAYYWNWFGFPATYFLVTVLDMTVGWTLAGLAVAKTLR